MTFYIISWNSQGQKLDSCKRLLKDEEPAVLLVQEAGNLPKAIHKDRNDRLPPDQRTPEPDYWIGRVYNLGEVEGYTCWWYGWTRQDEGKVRYADMKGNLRCSLAMFYKTSAYERNPPRMVESVREENKRLQKRPLMIAQIEEFLVGNIHAGGYDYIAQAVAIVSAQASRERKERARWAVAGDFNKQPGELAAYLKKAKDVPECNTVVPEQPTRGSRTIDFIVSNCQGSTTGKKVPITDRDKDRKGPTTRSQTSETFGDVMYYGPADHTAVHARLELHKGTAAIEEKQEKAEEVPILSAKRDREKEEAPPSTNRRSGRRRTVEATSAPRD